MVLADPAIRTLTENSGGQPYFVTFSHNKASLAITGTVPQSQVFALRTGSALALLIDTCRFLIWVRRMRIDAVVDFELFSRLSVVLCLLTGVKVRAGFHRAGGVGLYRGDLYTHPVPFGPDLHTAQNYLALAAALIAPLPVLPSPPPLPVLSLRTISRNDLDAVRARISAGLQAPFPDRGRLVLINPNASMLMPQRRWPEEHFVQLIHKVLKHFSDAKVLLIGSSDDRDSTGSICRQVNSRRCIDAAAWFPVEQLPALFSLSDAMISNDSGPAHFAAVTRMPVIVLFGPETPDRFRPLGNTTVLSAGLGCSPCVNVDNQRRTRCTDNQCMRKITVAQVFAATRAVLEPADCRMLSRTA